MPQPIWLWPVVATVFGCSAYLTLQLAAVLYGAAQPLPDGPRPARLRAGIPIAAAAVFGALFALHGVTFAALAVNDVVVSALCAVTWTDMTRGFIGDWFTVPPLVIVLVVATLRGTIVPVCLNVVIIAVPFVAGALFSKGRGVGWGDVKLIALGAALLNFQTSIVVFATTCFVACGVALATGRRNEPIAFAPYLAAAIACGLLVPVSPAFG